MAVHLNRNAEFVAGRLRFPPGSEVRVILALLMEGFSCLGYCCFDLAVGDDVEGGHVCSPVLGHDSLLFIATFFSLGFVDDRPDEKISERSGLNW